MKIKMMKAWNVYSPGDGAEISDKIGDLLISKRIADFVPGPIPAKKKSKPTPAIRTDKGDEK